MSPGYVTALAGIAGLLLGTLATGFMQWLSERRRERAQAHVAAGFISSQLLLAQLTLQAALDEGRWWPPTSAPDLSFWEKWGPPLLTGARGPRADKFHNAALALGSLNASAAMAHRPVEQAQQARDRARAGQDTDAQAAAEAELAQAQAGMSLTEPQRALVQTVVSTVTAAQADVPKRRLLERVPPRVRPAVPWLVTVVVLALLVVGTVVVVNRYKKTTVTANEVATAVGGARGALQASCSPVENVENRFTCELTYPAAAAACPLLRASSPAKVASVGALALVASVTPCQAQAASTDQVSVDQDRQFTDRLGQLIVDATAPRAKRAQIRFWKKREPELVTGTVRVP